MRIVGLCLVLPLALLLAVRIVWGIEAARRMSGTTARLRAEAFRYSPEDFPDDSDIPPSQNAIPDFLKAMSSTGFSTADLDLISPASDVPLAELERTPQEIRDLEALWESKASLFSALDSLEGRPAVATRSGLDLTHWGSLGRMRATAQLLLAMAKIRHAQHREAEALHDLRRILLIARLADQCPLVIGHLVSIAIRVTGANAIEPLEPSLDLQDPTAAAEAARLIEELLEPSSEEGQQRMLEGELAYAFKEGPTFLPTFQAWWIRPLYENELCRIADEYLQARRAMRNQTWQDLHAMENQWVAPKTGSNLGIATHLVQTQLAVSIDRGTEIHTRITSDCRAAAMLLASRLHAARHGKLPQDASALVPGELAAVPLDPFTRSPAPMRFRLDPQGVTVWSVGRDGIDDQAPVLFDALGRKRRRWGSGDPGDSPDIVYGAAWRTAATAPATGK